MKKKILLIVIFAVAIIGIGAYGFTYTNSHQDMQSSLDGNERPSSFAMWPMAYENDTDMIKDSDLIVIGKVIDSYTELRTDVVFTRHIVKIKEKIAASDKAKDETGTFEISQTGGAYEGVYTGLIEGVPFLEKGKTYILLLKKATEDCYLAMDAEQGIGEIVKGKMIFNQPVFELLDHVSIKDGIARIQIVLESR